MVRRRLSNGGEAPGQVSSSASGQGRAVQRSSARCMNVHVPGSESEAIASPTTNTRLPLLLARLPRRRRQKCHRRVPVPIRPAGRPSEEEEPTCLPRFHPCNATSGLGRVHTHAVMYCTYIRTYIGTCRTVPTGQRSPTAAPPQHGRTSWVFPWTGGGAD